MLMPLVGRAPAVDHAYAKLKQKRTHETNSDHICGRLSAFSLQNEAYNKITYVHATLNFL